MEMLNLYDLFVTYTFGGVFTSIIGMAMMFAVIGIFSRMSPKLIIYLLMLFLVCMGIGWGGAIFIVPVFVLGLIYFISGIINFIGKIRA